MQRIHKQTDALRPSPRFVGFIMKEFTIRKVFVATVREFLMRSVLIGTVNNLTVINCNYCLKSFIFEGCKTGWPK